MLKNIIIQQVILSIISITAMINHSKAEPMDRSASEYLPQEIYGWKSTHETEMYNRMTIYDYMDGAAEIYLAYDFRELIVQQYIKEQSPKVVVEIFEMGSSEDAFGIFSHVHGRNSRNKRETGIGQDSEYKNGLLCFWKNRFFICIHAERETSQVKKAVISMGREISNAIRAEGERPKLIDYLPKKDLATKTIRFFRKHVILNYHYYVADDNILNLNESTMAVLARYKNGGHLLLIQYQNSEEAKAGFENFIYAYMPEAKQTGIIKTENNRWTAARREQNFVVIVFDAITRTSSVTKIEAAINKLK